MSRESRVKKSLLNARMNMICYMVSLLVAFFTRKVLLDSLGADFIGLTGTLGSLLGFLNLAELGVGSAIGYVLYKPIFDGDRGKICEIISVFGYIYRWIGLVILGAGVVLSLFLPLIFADTPFSWGIIYLGFYCCLASSMLGYFVNYRQTLLGADQRNYVVTGLFQATTTTKVILQMVLAIYVRSFALYFLIELLFGIVNSCLLSHQIRKTYPWLESDVRLGRKLFSKYPEIGRYVKQLFIHKIGAFVQFEISPMLIYMYVSLPVVALYGNYTIVTQRIQGLVSGILDSTGAGVGNLVSEGDAGKIYATFRELFALRFLVVGILSCCVFFLVSPFVSVWLGAEYVLSRTVVLLLAVNFFLISVRGSYEQFLFGYGLFSDVWAPAVESAIFVLAAMAGGSVYGLAGVLLAPIISQVLIIYIWKPYFLYSRGFRRPFWQFGALFMQHLLPVLAAGFAADRLFALLCDPALLSSSWRGWIMGSALLTLLSALLTLAALYAVSPPLRALLGRFAKGLRARVGKG